MGKLGIILDQNIKDELKRLIIYQIDYALGCSQNDHLDINDKIHELRKSFKIIRSVLRLLRDSIGYSVYYRENKFFRNLARKLSNARDNEVLLQRAVVTQQHMPTGLNNNAIEELIMIMTQRRDNSLENLITGENTFRTIAKELVKSKSKIKKLEINNEGFNVIQKGIKRIYKQSLQYLHAIEKDSDDHESLHNFRKRVKYLWFQMLILKPVYSTMIKAYGKTLEKISEELGLHRDYILFMEKMAQNNYFNLEEPQILFIKEFIDNEQNKIYKKAIEPAKKFFIEKPSDFVEKLKKYRELTLIMTSN